MTCAVAGEPARPNCGWCDSGVRRPGAPAVTLAPPITCLPNPASSPSRLPLATPCRSRYLANKCSIASRIDCFLETNTDAFGQKLKDQVRSTLPAHLKSANGWHVSCACRGGWHFSLPPLSRGVAAAAAAPAKPVLG